MYCVTYNAYCGVELYCSHYSKCTVHYVPIWINYSGTRLFQDQLLNDLVKCVVHILGDTLLFKLMISTKF
jgi:hypothetical protein